MQFFDNPRRVTAFVFFLQTIFAFMNMDAFFYYHLIFLFPLHFGFPFAFYYTYKYILMDLDSKDESTPVAKLETEYNDTAKEPTPSPVKKQAEVQAVVSRMQDDLLTKSEDAPAKKTDKHIQVIPANDVFTDEDTVQDNPSVHL